MQSPRLSARQSLRHLVLTIALLTGSLAALAGMSDASASTRIAIVDAGGSGGGTGATSERVPLVVSSNMRSIALIESNDPANVGMAIVFVASATTADATEIDLDHTDINFCIPCNGLA